MTEKPHPHWMMRARIAHERLTQRELVADGGVRDRDPEDDPQACSWCGCHIGLRSGDYCDPCAHELGEKPPLRFCEQCGRRYPEPQMMTLDVSTVGEYYPEFVYLCRGCSGDSEGGEP